MGFSNKPRSGGKYINFKTKENEAGKKESFLQNGGKLFTEFTGILVDISVSTDDVNGQEYEKLTLHLVDPDDNKVYELGFPIRSGYGYAFFCMCPNLNPAIPMTFSGGIEAMDNGNSWTKLFIKQDDKSVKWHYTKVNEEAYAKIPLVKTVTVGKGAKAQQVKDYSDRDEFIEKVIFGFKKVKVDKAHPGGVKAALANAPKNADVANDSIDNDPTSDLPWDL